MSKEKEIIIDGVDVSKCKYYSKKQQIYQATRPLCIMKDCCMLSNSTKPCTNNDCYFKQLRRLQDENKRLQMLSCANCGEKYLSPDGAELYEKNVQLQKENEEFIKVIDCKNGAISTLNEEIANLKRNYRVGCLRCEYKYTKADIDKYKQALEEIRGIAKNACDSSVCHYNCKQCSDGKIIEKINEVFGNE